MDTPYLPNLGEELTSLKRLQQSGWVLEANEHFYYFRHRESQQTVAIPYWVQELLQQVATQAKSEAQKAVRNSVGLE